MQFAAVVAGRPVQTDFAQVDATKFALQIPDADRVNHIVIFVFGDPFPPGFAATVHFLLPDKPWQMLGVLSNEKPSAIFRLSGLKPPSTGAGGMSVSASQDDIAMMAYESTMSLDATSPGITATLGISIETIGTQVQALPSSRQQSLVLSSARSGSSTTMTPAADGMGIALRILQHLYNYVTSFDTKHLPLNAHVVGGAPQPMSAFGSMTGATHQITKDSWIPVKAFEEWWTNVQRKCKLDPDYFVKHT
ncbi:hypothetical protein RI367_000026 [Sorochytrium milnesiophthora]